MSLTDSEKTSIISIVQQNVITEVEKRIDAEKSFVLSALKIAGWVTAFIAALFTFVGWNSLEGIKEQAKKDLITSTEVYLSKSSSVKEVQDTLDKYRVTALISYHLSRNTDVLELNTQLPSRALLPADAETLFDIICKGTREQAIIDGAVQVLTSGYSEPWWDRYERRLGEMVAPRGDARESKDKESCSRPEPSLRATIIELLGSSSADTDFFNRLKPILDTKDEAPEVKAAVIRYAGFLPDDTSTLKTIESLTVSGSPDIHFAALESLARAHPLDPALLKWLNDKAAQEMSQSSKGANLGFPIISLLMSGQVQFENFLDQGRVLPVRLAALRALVDAGVAFEPWSDSQGTKYWLPVRWKGGETRPPPGGFNGGLRRFALDVEVFQKDYGVLIANTIALPPTSSTRKLLTDLLAALGAYSLRGKVVLNPLQAQLSLGGAPLHIDNAASRRFEIQALRPDGHETDLKTAAFALIPVDEQGVKTGAASIQISEIHGPVQVTVSARTPLAAPSKAKTPE